MRTFIGIRLDDCINEINSLMDRFRGQDSKANYTKLNNIHLTLEFLGEIDAEELRIIEDIFSTLDFTEFSIELFEVTNLRDLIIIKVKENKHLNSLHYKLKQKLKENGFKLQNRKFFPHITLARKSNLEIDEVISLKSKVNKIYLFHSKRTSGGLHYIPLLERKLAKNISNK